MFVEGKIMFGFHFLFYEVVAEVNFFNDKKNQIEYNLLGSVLLFVNTPSVSNS